MSQPPRRIQSAFVRALVRRAGVPDDMPTSNEWPKVLEVVAQAIENAHEHKVITNGHVMAHAAGLIKFAMQFCPEEARGRVFDDFVADLRKEIVNEG